MGFLGRKKKNDVAASDTNAGGAFAPLLDAAHRGEPGAMDRLWAHIYQAPRWHFVRRISNDPLSTLFNPFCSTVDGKPSVFVFTDEQRASAFGVRQQLGAPGGFAVISMARDAAIKSILSLASSGVVQTVVNDQPPISCTAPLANLAPMYSHHLAVPLAEAAVKFDQDVAVVLHDRVSQTGNVEHLRELVAWAMRQQEWWMFANPAMPAEPLVWSAAGGEVTTAVFTSIARLERGAELMKLDIGAPRLQLPVAQAVGLIDQLRWAKSLQTVALNLRVPLDADKVAAMHRVLAN